jgi:2-alkyl-3-oxoalkanoate reductase
MKVKALPRLVITGAAGFLGGRTAKYFAQKYTNHTVVPTSRREISLANFMQGDLCEATFCEAVTAGAEIIVHCAALSSPYGVYDDFYQANVVATQNLLNASIKNGVKKFVFISTPSIYFDFTDRFEVKESQPLPTRIVNHYASTKLIAENNVLAMNNPEFATLALRPRAIIGAEDTVILPRVLEAYHKGKLKIVGKGNNICDFTCARNVIEAIDCAIHAPSDAFGEAYNITDGTPIKFWDALRQVLQGLGLKPPTQRVPKQLAMWVGGFLEWKARFFEEKKEPVLTRYSVGVLANSLTMDISKARQKLNYQPVMTTQDGINEYIQWKKAQ